MVTFSPRYPNRLRDFPSLEFTPSTKALSPDRRGKQEVSDTHRKEFLEAARQYLFGMLSSKTASIGM